VRRRLVDELGVEDAYLRGMARTLVDPRAWRAFTTEQRMLIRELPALERRLEAIRAPTVVVAGSADRIVAPSAARALAGQIPGAELVQLSGATHLLPQQRPAELAGVILAAAGAG
jgi:pimeloyl-ACP methyl ester carboxylesterase